MTHLVSLGFQSWVRADDIQSIFPPKSMPVRRLIKAAKTDNKLIDLSFGHSVKTVLFCKDGYLYFVAITPETMRARLEGKEKRSGKRTKNLSVEVDRES